MKYTVEQFNNWRNQYNPLRGLTISKAVSLFEQANRGIVSELQWTYFFIEQLDADLLSLIERRTTSLLEMDWQVKIVSEHRTGFDAALADLQRDTLESAYSNLLNLYEVIEHMEMAAFRGYSHAQYIPEENRFELLDQWNFVRDGLYGSWKWNPTASSQVYGSTSGNPINASRDLVLIREAKRPINKVALLKYIRQNLGQKDWDAFIETYGLPGWIITLPANIPENKVSEYAKAAENVATGGSGALPNGSTATCADSPRGSNPFKDYLSHLSEKLILAGTGGMLTMLTQSGSGTLAGGAHSETFAQIARGEARRISELFQRLLDSHILSAAFPGKPTLAYFELSAREEQNIGEIVEHAAKLRQAGFAMDPAQLTEKTGYDLTPAEPAAPASAAGIPALNRSNTVAAPADDPDPLNFSDLPNQGTDAEWMAALEAKTKQLVPKLSTLNIHTVADPLEQAMSAAAARAVAEVAAKSKTIRKARQ